MRSGLKRLLDKASKPPIPLVTSSSPRGLSFDLGGGTASQYSHMRAYGRSGTVYAIVSLLAQSAAAPEWQLFKKQPQDGRRRYTTADQGDDQRVQIINHAALSLWDHPNDFQSGFEFRESVNQHMELCGETFWVLDREKTGFPTSMWMVRPDRMQPATSSDNYLLGWIYTGPDGSIYPLETNEVIQEKTPDPLEPFRGASPVASIMPNIDQQRYATEYQRNLFINGADPGGVISVPGNLNEEQWDEFTDRWRETHQGIARAGAIAVLENGMQWLGTGPTNKDLEYGNLRLNNRDEIREAFRMHKSLLGTVEDVNRANAQTAEEVFVESGILPRLDRRKHTLNHKLLPLFGATGQGIEFDYVDPSPENAEAAMAELVQKATAAQLLITSGFDSADVLETVGLPTMDVAEKAVQSPALPPGWVPEMPAAPAGGEPDQNGPTPGPPAATAREIITLLNKQSSAAAAVFQQQQTDFPPSAMAWMHHASWSGPVKVPLSHIDPTMPWMDDPDPAHVEEFVQELEQGQKLKPVILVKTPDDDKLLLIDGHHRYLAYAQLDKPIRAFIGTVEDNHGPWEAMHTDQFHHAVGSGGGGDMSAQLAELFRSNLRPYTARALPAAAMNRNR